MIYPSRISRLGKVGSTAIAVNENSQTSRTPAGIRFNVFLVGDATLATFPANDSSKHATNAAISFASIDHMITQVSWVKYHGAKK
ncbi:MAG TPA: hypothetical protein VHR66_09900 [Gemmataceae bacterium]|jgi:hypothetical protein|nr:hypothetical protein [Gemmataceae bacterium]